MADPHLPPSYRGNIDRIPLLGRSPEPPEPSASSEIAALQREVRALRDREEIRQLMLDYGRTLDMRDFEGFGRLFARNGEYGGGMGGITIGPKAIGESLAHIYSMSRTPAPKFHVFFNEIIHVSGDAAVATSMSFFVATSYETRKPFPNVMASYDDEFVREDGAWRFRRRVVHGISPGAAS